MRRKKNRLKRRNILVLITVECVLALLILGLIYYFGGSAEKSSKTARKPSVKRSVSDKPVVYKPAHYKTSTLKEKLPTFAMCIYLADRAYNILYKIQKSNVELARDKKRGLRYSIGAYAMTNVHFPEGMQKMAEEKFNIGDGFTVVSVAKDGPAEQAGIKVYDRLVAINDRLIWKKPIRTSTKFLEARIKFNFMVNRFYRETGSVDLTVLRRDGTTHTLNIIPDLICNAKFNLHISTEFNAYAIAPRNIVITTEAIDFIDEDSALAMVLGHELAHITCLHSGKARATGIAGSLAARAIGHAVGVNLPGLTSRAGRMIGRTLFSHKYELEADYVGLYYAARAGYDVSNAADFWKKTVSTKKTSKTLGFFDKIENLKGKLSHPPYVERFEKTELASKEIHEKELHGEALVPDYKVFRQNF